MSTPAVILLADDQVMVRNLVRTILQRKITSFCLADSVYANPFSLSYARETPKSAKVESTKLDTLPGGDPRRQALGGLRALLFSSFGNSSHIWFSA
jgi:hypothetical protein